MNILSHLKTVAVTVFAVLAFASCTKEETSISINDLPGRAVVKGTVYYIEKQEYIPATSKKEAHIENVFTPVANKRVFLRISNASIVDDQEGYTTFETRTDANGNYEFKIPVPEDTISVWLQAEAFEGSCELVEGWVTSTRPNIQKKEGAFFCDWEDLSIEANTIEFIDIQYDFYERDLIENTEADIPMPTTLTVRVGLADYKISYDDYDHIPCFKATSNITVEIYEDGELIQTGKTDRNGEAKFDFLPNGYGYAKDIQIRTSSSTPSFDYWSNYGSFKAIEGSFKQISSWYYLSPILGTKETIIYFDGGNKTESVAMIFEPSNFSSVGGEYSYYNNWRSAYNEWISY